MMEWYLKVVRDNYANFEGRARRSEYWYFLLLNIIIAMLLFLSSFLLGMFGMILYIIYALATFIPGIAVAVRRLHDTGKSGWFYFVALIPIIGGIWLLIVLATEGTPGPNEYGPDPKNDYNEFDQIGNNQPY
jgi:uncharacterized membrane protein YhaH (DUF805 family)